MKTTDSPRVKSRKLWDRHGSWLILIVVIGVSFNGGTEWQAYKDRQVLAGVISSGVNERNQLRERLRVRTDEVVRLTKELADKSGKTQAEATKAVEKASELLDKADKIIEGTSK